MEVDRLISLFAQRIGGYIAYDVLVGVKLEEGDSLSNLVLLNGSVEPNDCSIGDEDYSVDTNQVELSHLLVLCTAEFFLTAKVW